MTKVYEIYKSKEGFLNHKIDSDIRALFFFAEYKRPIRTINDGFVEGAPHKIIVSTPPERRVISFYPGSAGAARRAREIHNINPRTYNLPMPWSHIVSRERTYNDEFRGLVTGPLFYNWYMPTEQLRATSTLFFNRTCQGRNIFIDQPRGEFDAGSLASFVTEDSNYTVNYDNGRRPTYAFKALAAPLERDQETNVFEKFERWESLSLARMKELNIPAGNRNMSNINSFRSNNYRIIPHPHNEIVIKKMQDNNEVF